MDKDLKVNVMALSAVFAVAIALILTLYIGVITTSNKISAINFGAESGIQFANPNSGDKNTTTSKPVIVENKNVKRNHTPKPNERTGKTEEVKTEKKDDSNKEKPEGIPHAGLEVNFAIGIVLAALVVFSKITMSRYNKSNDVVKMNKMNLRK